MLRILKSSAIRDVVSGLAARLLPGLASILAVPVLVQVLGPQHYAAIGIFLTVQALSGLLDVGLAASIGRQAAWLTGADAAPREFGALLHSFEIPYLSIASVVLLTGVFAGRSILTVAFHLEPESIGLDSRGIAFLFACIGVRFPFSLYSGYLSGRRYIQTANYIFLITECARIIGVLALMVWVGPNLSLFFAWQLFIGVIASVTAIAFSYKITLVARVPPDWRGMMELRGVLLGAGQMLLLFGIANNLDKFFLPRFVSAAEYGIYVAVGQLAISNFLIIQPIWAAFHPRLLGAMAASDTRSTHQVFLSAAGVMTALCCAFMVGTITATPAILHLWVRERGVGFDWVLILIAASYGFVGLSHLAMTIHQAAGRYFPTPLIFAVSIIVVPAIGFLTLARIDVTSMAALCALIYACEFLAGALTFRLYAARLLPVWVAYVILPLLIAVLAGVLLASWTHALAVPAQLALAVGFAALTGLLVVAFNPAIRYWVKFHLASGPC